MVSNISHSGVLTQIRRDALRRETSRIDGRSNVTRIEYDALGRVAVTVDALTNATTYAYDPMGRVAAVTNALGDATIYEYDHRGNTTYEGGATYPVRYTYDIYGNKTTMTTDRALHRRLRPRRGLRPRRYAPDDSWLRRTNGSPRHYAGEFDRQR